VHINIPIDEPLLPQCVNAVELNQLIDQLSQKILQSTHCIKLILPTLKIKQTSINKLVQLINSGQGLIICGRLTIDEQRQLPTLLAQLSKKINCPVLLDPLSNQRLKLHHPHYSYNYHYFLNPDILSSEQNNTQKLKPDWIIQLGQFPVSKHLMNYLQPLDCTHILVSSYGDKLNPIATTYLLLHCVISSFCQQLINSPIKKNNEQWLTLWQKREQRAEKKIQQSLHTEVLFEGHIINAVLKYLPAQSLIFSGNSMAIRDFDTFITSHSATNQAIDFFANRGVSGIDGNISSFLGLLAASSLKTKAIAVLGDLSFYHDMNGLLISKMLATLGYNATIILINNSGGGIFNYLPQQQLDSFNKLWITDTGLDFQHSAKLYQLNYLRIENKTQFNDHFAHFFSQSGMQLIEIIIDQKTSVECHHNI
jgi:2-succinyl-5-enolpyruvyl-6-hydroxy-3-cyclohexene-1-carboxylate synthase